MEVVVAAVALFSGDCGTHLSGVWSLLSYSQDWRLYTEPREIFEVLSWLESWYVLGIKKKSSRNLEAEA